MKVSVTIAIRSGATLLSEPYGTDDPRLATAFAEANQLGWLDGGLDIHTEAERLSWNDVWDHVDGMLLAWIEAIDAIAAGKPDAIAVFPDTKVECEMMAVGDKNVQIEYEDVAATVDVQALQDGLLAATERLLAIATAHDTTTPALKQLGARIEQRVKP